MSSCSSVKKACVHVCVRAYHTDLESGQEDQTGMWPAWLVQLSLWCVSEQCRELPFSSVVAAELAVAVIVVVAAAVPCVSVSFPLQGENNFFKLKWIIPVHIKQLPPLYTQT